MTAFQPQGPEQSSTNPENTLKADPAAHPSLDTSMKVLAPGQFLTALRNVLGRDEEVRNGNRDILLQAQDIIEEILVEGTEVEAAVGDIRELAEENMTVAGMFHVYIKNHSKDHGRFLIEKICRSSFAWEFIEESFRSGEEIASDILYTLHSLNFKGKQNILDSVRCHFSVQLEDVAKNLMKAAEPISLVNSLIRNVRMSYEDFDLANDDYDQYRENLNYISRLTLLVLEDFYTAGYSAVTLSELSSFYDSCDPSLLDEVADLARCMYPASAHGIYLKRFAGANPRIDLDRQAMSESYNNFRQDLVLDQIDPKRAAKDIATLINSGVKIPPTLLLRMCFDMVSNLFEEHGRNALKEIIVSNILEGKKPRILANILRLTEISWTGVDAGDITGVVRSAFAVNYQDPELLMKSIRQLHKIDVAVLRPINGHVNFTEKTGRTSAIEMMANVGWPNVLTWAAGDPEYPSLAPNVRNVVNVAYAIAPADDKYECFEGPIGEYIKYDGMLASLVKDLAGFHPSDLE